jgi:hypothetical protein
MATEPSRRRAIGALLGGAALPLLPARAGATPRALLAAAWTLRDDEARSQIGLLAFDGRNATVVSSIDLPGRAHGLVARPDGSLLAVARRPGEWLLHWHPASGRPRWQWIEPDRVFTGHALLDAKRHRLYTAETDLDTGRGLLGVRDAQSLAKLAEWPTHGLDPHSLVWDAEGRLIVANGGIASRPETGRRKLTVERMEASLVRLAPDDGALLGQWRLSDERLSIRHLAWAKDAEGRAVLGIALQAEHEAVAERAAAPVLALFDGERLHAAAAGEDALGGYGGDIAASQRGFVVSCTRADAGGRVAHKATSRPMRADRVARRRVVHGGGRSALATNRPAAAVGNPCSPRCGPCAANLTLRRLSAEGVNRLPCPCGDCLRRSPSQGPSETRSPQDAGRPRRAPRCSARPSKLERLFMSFPPRLPTRTVIPQLQGVCP